jgi:hypothetical protein
MTAEGPPDPVVCDAVAPEAHPVFHVRSRPATNTAFGHRDRPTAWTMGKAG